MIRKTGMIVTKGNAFEWFNFLDSTLQIKKPVSFFATKEAMGIFTGYVWKNKFKGLAIIKQYKNGLVHMVKVR